MRTYSTFLIESELSRHRPLLNGEEIATFATLDGAEAEANKIVNRAIPGITLRFELDFEWALSDLETCTAAVEADSEKPVPCSHRSTIRRGSICG